MFKLPLRSSRHLVLDDSKKCNHVMTLYFFSLDRKKLVSEKFDHARQANIKRLALLSADSYSYVLPKKNEALEFIQGLIS